MLPIKLLKLTASALAFISCATFATEEVYKWTATNDSTHYKENYSVELRSKSIKAKTDPAYKQSTITSKPVSIIESNQNGITRYVFRTNEHIGKHSRWPNELTISNNTLWLTFKNSILEFNLDRKTAKKHKLNKTHSILSTQNMYISGDYFIFLNTNEKPSSSSFHIYKHKTNVYKIALLNTTSHKIINYEDQYDDGILTVDYKNNLLTQYDNANTLWKTNIENETKHVSDRKNSGAVSTSEKTIWQISGNKKPCSVSRYDKKSQYTESFDYINMGVSDSSICGWIASDNDEAWVTSFSKKLNAAFSIFNIKNKTWETIYKSKNNITLNQAPLQMNQEYIYYHSCEKLIALNRGTRNASIFTTDLFDIASKKTYCISGFKIHDDSAWVLKFEDYKHRVSPVLYKIPLNAFNTRYN